MARRHERLRPLLDGPLRSAQLLAAEGVEELLLAGGDRTAQLDPAVHHRPVRSHREEVRPHARQSRRQVRFTTCSVLAGTADPIYATSTFLLLKCDRIVGI